MGDDWAATSVLMTRRYRFLVLLKKNPPAPRVTENVVGVDQNSNGVAVTVMNKQSGRILRQLYLGRDISLRQIRYENRRAALQEHRDKDGHRGKAGLKLRRLSGRQRNYVRTNTWLLVKHLTDLAIQHGASIAIERLYKLRRRKGELGRKSRRKMNRIPYGFFRHALTHKSAQIGIPVVQVPAKYTSQTCPRCGYVSRRNRRNWRYFRCVGCRYEANADRVANVNICRKAIQATYPVTRDQILPTGASVRRLDMQDEEDSWQPETPQSCKLPTLVAEKLTSAYLQLPVHKIVKRFKGRSSHMLRREFPELLKLPSLWTHSNFVSTAGHVSAKTIQEYIQRQSKR
jgi:IS605 OrfB family transposase